ncbi:MAG: lasso peptide biosynthesis B2 protein [Sphingobium limneticum]
MQLSTGAYVVNFGGQAIVLNLQQDRYVYLGPHLSTVAGKAIDKGLSDEERLAAVRELVSKGILDDDCDRRSYQFETDEPISLPRSTSWPSIRFGLGLGGQIHLTLKALRALYDVGYSLRTRPFIETVQYLRDQRRAGRKVKPKQSANDALDSFFAARPWFPTPPVCRLDASALCLHLWRSGHDASLVFGVRIEPFSAHCWAQGEEASLNEPHDQLRQYTPIMAI